MILVVSDTSPINYLVLINAVDALRIFDRVVIPNAVYAELTAKDSPKAVSDWVKSPPTWLEVRSPQKPQSLGLDAGETEALALAKELKAFAVLLDERQARKVARQHGLPVTGTLAVLEKAASAGLIDLPSAIQRLRKTNFRSHPRLLKDLLDRISKK